MPTTRNIKGDLVEEIPFQTIGGSGVPEPIRGGQGLISTADAVAQEVKKGIGDLAIVLTQGQIQTEKGLDSVAKLLQDLKEVQVAIAKEGANVSVEGTAPRAPRMPTGERPPPPPPQLIRSGFQESREAFSIGNVRQALGSRLSNRLSDWDFGDSPIARTPNGDFIDTTTGDFISPSSPLVQQLLRNEQITSAVRGGAQALASGESIGGAASKALGAIPAGATLLKGLGVAGAGFAAVQMGTNWLEDQRAKNAQWQSQLGGTQMDAVGERWNQRMFGWSQMGFMGGADAERLYREVAMTGLQGDERTQAQQFALSNYRSMGMGIDESMGYVREAAKHGTDALVGLSGALRRVSDDAREAGVNAEKMRKQMFANWEAATQQTGAGAISNINAEAAATMFGDSRLLSGSDTSGVFGDTMMYQIAARNQMDIAEVRLRSSTDQGWYAAEYDALTGGSIERVAPGLAAWLRDHGINSVTPDNLHQVFEAVMGWASSRGIDPMMLHGTIDTIFGVKLPMDVTAIAEFLATKALGGGSFSEGATKAEEAYDYNTISQETRRYINDRQGWINLGMGGMMTGGGEEATRLIQSYSDSEAGQRYLQGISRGGIEGGLSKRLVEEHQAMDIHRLRDSEGKEYKIAQLLRTAEGIQRLNEGDFTVVGGENDGVDLETALAMSGTQSPEPIKIEIVPNERMDRWFDVRYDDDWNPGDPHMGR